MISIGESVSVLIELRWARIIYHLDGGYSPDWDINVAQIMMHIWDITLIGIYSISRYQTVHQVKKIKGN